MAKAVAPALITLVPSDVVGSLLDVHRFWLTVAYPELSDQWNIVLRYRLDGHLPAPSPPICALDWKETTSCDMPKQVSCSRRRDALVIGDGRQPWLPMPRQAPGDNAAYSHHFPRGGGGEIGRVVCRFGVAKSAGKRATGRRTRRDYSWAGRRQSHWATTWARAGATRRSRRRRRWRLTAWKERDRSRPGDRRQRRPDRPSRRCSSWMCVLCTGVSIPMPPSSATTPIRCLMRRICLRTGPTRTNVNDSLFVFVEATSV